MLAAMNEHAKLDGFIERLFRILWIEANLSAGWHNSLYGS
jgi:hypothetical protein